MEPTRSPRRTRTRPYLLPLDPDVEPDLRPDSPRWPRVVCRGLTVGELLDVQRAEAEAKTATARAEVTLETIGRYIVGVQGDFSLYFPGHPPGAQAHDVARVLHAQDVQEIYSAIIALSVPTDKESDPLGGGPRL